MIASERSLPVLGVALARQDQKPGESESSFISFHNLAKLFFWNKLGTQGDGLLVITGLPDRYAQMSSM